MTCRIMQILEGVNFRGLRWGTWQLRTWRHWQFHKGEFWQTFEQAFGLLGGEVWTDLKTRQNWHWRVLHVICWGFEDFLGVKGIYLPKQPSLKYTESLEFYGCLTILKHLEVCGHQSHTHYFLRIQNGFKNNVHKALSGTRFCIHQTSSNEKVDD